MLSEKLKNIDLSRPAHVDKKHRPLKIGDLVFIRDMVFEVQYIDNRQIGEAYYNLKFLEYTKFIGKTKRPELP